MGRKHTKSEKLDLVLSELSELRGEVKKLLKDRAAIADPGVKAPSKSTPARRSKRCQNGPSSRRNQLRMSLHQSRYWFRPLPVRRQASVPADGCVVKRVKRRPDFAPE
jgi:hypothetical protein